MKLISWVVRTAVLAVVILFAANTFRVDRRTLNEHFLGALAKIQVTDQARAVQRGVAGWLKLEDRLATSKSQAIKNSRAPERPVEAEASPWERRELEKILRE